MGFLDLLATLAGVDFAPLMPDAVRSNIGGLTPDVNRINFSQPGDSAWGGTRLAQGAYGDSGDQLRSRFSGGITELDRLTYRRDNPNAQPTKADELGAIARGEKPPRPQTQPGAQQQQGQPGRQAQAFGAAAQARLAGTLGSIDQSSRDAYLRTAMPYFQQIEAQTGIPAESLAAISINEGATVPGTLAYSSGAPFGIKSVGQDANGNDISTGFPVTRTNAWEVINGQNTTQPSAFINFPDPQAAIQGFVDFLQRNPRYAGALQAAGQGTTPQDFNALLGQAGYATDPNWVRQINSIADEASRYRVAAAAAPVSQPSTITPTGAPISSGLSQFGQGLSDAEARAACGPAAAAWFAQNFGRNPTVLESMQIAKQGGMWRGQMQGPASEVRLLQQLGVPAQMVTATPQRVAAEIQEGRPVILDTPGHYYQVTAFNPDNGTFRLGDAVGNGRWSTLDGIANLGYGAVRTAIVLRQ